MSVPGVGRVAEEQAALRRVATLVAHGVPAEELLAAVAEGVGHLLPVEYAYMARYESDAAVTLLASWTSAGQAVTQVPTRWPVEELHPWGIARKTGRPARVDSYARIPGSVGVAARELGICSGVAVPIIVEDRIWGVIGVASTSELREDTETRLLSFTELVATAIANAESSAGLARLAEGQAALRRVATLVARGALPEEVFVAVPEEVGQLLGTHRAALARYDSDDAVTVLATWAEDEPGGHSMAPHSWPLGGDDVASTIARTGRPVRIDDYDGIPGPIAAFVRDELGVASTVGCPIVVEGRLWGGLYVHSKETHQPLPQDTESRLTAFTELVATAIANAESSAGLARLAQEQAALRRVATLVAHGVPAEELFAAVTGEVERLLPVDAAYMGRYESDGMMTEVAASTKGDARFPVGRRWSLGGHNISTIVAQTGLPARIDSYAGPPGEITAAARERGLGSSIGTPILVEGRVWGVMTAASGPEQPLPADTEARLASFTDLVATAIANAESSAGLARLAEEQAALRRVATLVARGVPPEELFAAVTEEVGLLLPVEAAYMGRYDSDACVTQLAGWTKGGWTVLAVGTRWPDTEGHVGTIVRQTGRPARIDDYSDVPGRMGARARALGVCSGAAAPIIVEDRIWGMMGVGSKVELPEDTEARLASFTELVATAIANAESRAELAASRARIVASADETRRRIERDLHDGAQQRLISLGLELRAAQAAAPPELRDLNGELSRVAEGLLSVQDELREMARGIHPAILAEGGLGPALRTLARRSPIPVEIELRAESRLPERVEVAAYYVVSEALTNAAKHADAAVVRVEAEVADGVLRLCVRDDGDGGADSTRGSGIVGLKDRVETLGGTITVQSPLGAGTSVQAELPIDMGASSSPA